MSEKDSRLQAMRLVVAALTVAIGASAAATAVLAASASETALPPIASKKTTCPKKLFTVSGQPPVTVMAAVPVFPSTVAVIVAVPGACAVTMPDDVTVATLGRFVDHITTRPVSTLPDSSSGCACSWAV